jgi:hypothetical protein
MTTALMFIQWIGSGLVSWLATEISKTKLNLSGNQIKIVAGVISVAISAIFIAIIGILTGSIINWDVAIPSIFSALGLAQLINTAGVTLPKKEEEIHNPVPTEDGPYGTLDFQPSYPTEPEPVAPPEPEPIPEPTLGEQIVSEVERYVGRTDGDTFGSSVCSYWQNGWAWCSAFARYVFTIGLTGDSLPVDTNEIIKKITPSSQSWLSLTDSVDVIPDGQQQVGDVCVMTNKNGDGGHVCFVYNPETEEYIGGNQSGQVCIKKYPRNYDNGRWSKFTFLRIK